jgi:HD superfamily phosphohydrolase
MNRDKDTIQIKDAVHGFIEIRSWFFIFIDHPYFQRLRRVKQLGVVDRVYPNATHTRFEHSLGVFHLTGLIIDRLNRDSLLFTETEKDLIQLAALYHDIGHGPFSHLYEKFMINKYGKDTVNHEERACMILEEISQDKCALLSDENLKFISNVIKGIVPENEINNYKYQIVNNKLCGIDSDKMDYLARDTKIVDITAFRFDYIINNMSVCKKTRNVIFNIKSKIDIENLFYTRMIMHKMVYQHKSVLKIARIYYCMYCRTEPIDIPLIDDYTFEYLVRNNGKCKYLIYQLENLNSLTQKRNIDHECDLCKGFSIIPDIKESGTIENVIFFK